jgi:hypothetical protein
MDMQLGHVDKTPAFDRVFGAALRVKRAYFWYARAQLIDT